MLSIEEQHAEHLVLQRPDLQPQMVLDGLRRRHRGTAPHAVGQHAPRVAQHLLSKRRTVLPVDITHHQGIGRNGSGKRD